MTAGVVLCGGASRRMGRTKALVPVDGVPMGRRVVEALVAGGCDPVVLVGGDPVELAALGCEVVDDRWPGEGPLGGIRTALAWSAPGGVVVAACDLPGLDAETVRRLLAAAASTSADAVLARSSRREPAIAWWSPTAAASLAAAFDAGERAVHRALDGLRVVEVDVAPGVVRNVNTPADLG